MGFVGIGSPQSRSLSGDLYGGAKKYKAQCAAVCDVDARHLKRAADQFKKDGFTDVKTYSDFRRLTDDKSLDTVLVATPDHWHTLVAIDALRKGKDVYCEKPLTLTIEEAVALKTVVEQTGRVLQTGNQQRTEFGGRFRLASEIVRSGRLGKVRRIECRIGDNPQSGPIPEAPVPDGLDWDMWLGPTAKVPYRISADGKNSNCHYEFRWWYEYSGGKLTDWGAHHIDIAQAMLGRDGDGPTEVEAMDASEPLASGDGYNVHNKFRVRFTYADGAEVLVTGSGGTDVTGLKQADGKSPTRRERKRFKVKVTEDGKEVEKDSYKDEFVPVEVLSGGENGVMVFGQTGNLFVSRGQLLASDPKLLTEPLKDATALYPTTAKGAGGDHIANFFDCVKSREKPICHVGVGAGSVIVCHLAVIALRTGKPLTWDSKANRFTGANAEVGNAMIGRPMRGPWKLDV
jgi:predicted dehydrogenase